jgi:hypothetical protein
MIKIFLKRIVPKSLWQQIKKVVFLNKTHDNIDIRYAGKSISNIFNEIYQNDNWAKVNEVDFKETNSKFYSGPGSYNEAARQ